MHCTKDPDMTPESSALQFIVLGTFALGCAGLALSMLGDWLHDRKRKTR